MCKKVVSQINLYFKKIALLLFTIISMGVISQAGATAPATLPAPLPVTPAGQGPSAQNFNTLIKAVNRIKSNTKKSSNEITAAIEMYNLQKFASSLSSADGDGSGSAADWNAGQQSAAKSAKDTIGKNVAYRLTQINNGILPDPENSVLGESGYSKPATSKVFTPDQNLFALSLAIPGKDSIFKSGSKDPNDLGSRVIENLIQNQKSHAKSKERGEQVSKYLNTLISSDQRGSFNFESLFSPEGDTYSDDKSKSKGNSVENNYLLLLNSSYSEYFALMYKALKTISAHVPVTAVDKDAVINYYTTLLDNPKYQNTILKLRREAAQRSVISSAMQFIYEERKKQQDSGKSLLAMERADVINSDCASDSNGCLQVMLRQNFQAHLDRERMISLEAVVASNLLNASHISSHGDLAQLQSAIKNASKQYSTSSLSTVSHADDS